MATTTPWTKASTSGEGSGCVEVRGLDDGGAQRFQIRDSKDPDGPALTFDKHEIRCFLDGRDKGEFIDVLSDLL